jgi:uncharacterized protein
MSSLQALLEEIVARPSPADAVREIPEVGIARRVAFVPEVRGASDEERTITFVASTESVDRYGDIVRVAGWQTKNYMQNPVFLFGHQSGQPPIGKTVKLTKESGAKPALVQKVQFATKEAYPFADTIFQLYKGGFMSAVSVGFRPLEKPNLIRDEEGNWTGGFEFTSQELLELSAVPIPANTDAVARAIDAGILDDATVSKYFGEQQRETPPSESEPATREQIAGALLKLSTWQLQLSLSKLEATLIRKELEDLLAGPEKAIVAPSEKAIETLDQLFASISKGRRLQ